MIATKTAAGSEKAPARKVKLPPELVAGEKLGKKGPLFLDVKSIERGDNPRETFGDDELQALADSIKRASMLAPITVTPINEPGPERYELVCGERRMRAAKLAGFRKIFAYVVVAPRAVLIELRADENLLRVDLNPIERARQIDELHKPIEEGGAGKKLEEIALRYGHKGPWAVRQVALLKLPAEWQKRIAGGAIDVRQGYALSVHFDRPEVLAAVAADMAANPDDWAGVRKFDAALANVVERLDSLAAAARSAGAAENGAARGTFPGEMPGRSARGAEPALPPIRRSSHVDHELTDEEEEALVAQMAGRGRQAPEDPDAEVSGDGHREDYASLIGRREDAPADPVAAIVNLFRYITTAAEVERLARAFKKLEAEILRG